MKAGVGHLYAGPLVGNCGVKLAHLLRFANGLHQRHFEDVRFGLGSLLKFFEERHELLKVALLLF